MPEPTRGQSTVSESFYIGSAAGNSDFVFSMLGEPAAKRYHHLTKCSQVPEALLEFTALTLDPGPSI